MLLLTLARSRLQCREAVLHEHMAHCLTVSRGPVLELSLVLCEKMTQAQESISLAAMALRSRGTSASARLASGAHAVRMRSAGPGMWLQCTCMSSSDLGAQLAICSPDDHHLVQLMPKAQSNMTVMRKGQEHGAQKQRLQRYAKTAALKGGGPCSQCASCLRSCRKAVDLCSRARRPGCCACCAAS